MKLSGIDVKAGIFRDGNAGSPGHKTRKEYRANCEKGCLDALEDFAESFTRRHL
jgi:hypothetical protein